MSALYELKGISQRYHGRTVLDIANLRLEPGRIYALTGPNGAGKSTLLRLLAFLEAPAAGALLFQDEPVRFTSSRSLLALRRRVVLVDQHPVVFSTTVAKNIEFGLKIRKTPKDERTRLVNAVLETVGLSQYCHGPARELSGGETQRLALARALAVEPKVLLLDEPFGALDAKVRKELRRWLARLHEDINLTSVFVTHDQEEAMEVADRIVVMNKGVIEQIGSPGDVYENPASDFVYHFLGDSNRLHLGEDKHLLFRPHEVSLSRHELEDHHAAQVRDIRPLGATTRVTLKVEGQSELIEAEVVKDHDSLTGLARGETLFFKPKVWQKA